MLFQLLLICTSFYYDDRFLIIKYNIKILISFCKTFTLHFMYPLFVLSCRKRTFQKIHCMYVPLLLLLRYFPVPEKTQPPLAKTILIPAHSTLPFSHNSRARMRFALTFAITLTWSRHRSHREKWQHSISALTAFSRFSGRSRFPRHFCL